MSNLFNLISILLDKLVVSNVIEANCFGVIYLVVLSAIFIFVDKIELISEAAIEFILFDKLVVSNVFDAKLLGVT